MLWSYCGTRAARASGILCGTKVKKDRTEFIMFFSFFVVFFFVFVKNDGKIDDRLNWRSLYLCYCKIHDRRAHGGRRRILWGRGKKKNLSVSSARGEKNEEVVVSREREREMREYNGKKCGSEKRKKIYDNCIRCNISRNIWIASLAYHRYVICRCLSEKKKKNKKKRNISVGTLGSIVRPWPLSNC